MAHAIVDSIGDESSRPEQDDSQTVWLVSRPRNGEGWKIEGALTVFGSAEDQQQQVASAVEHLGAKLKESGFDGELHATDDEHEIFVGTGPENGSREG